MNKKTNDKFRLTRIMFVLEQTFEYFISIIISGAYLSKATSAIGLSDSVTGILSSFVSLGCGFQLIAIYFANRRPLKRCITILHILNQSFFAMVYAVPLLDLPGTALTLLFVFLLLLGHIINNVVNSLKINFFMSAVDNESRGTFTAAKEIISLLTGIIFSFVSGYVIDCLESQGKEEGAFIYCGAVIFALMLLHTLTILFSGEKDEGNIKKQNLTENIRDLINDKGFLKVILISVLWNIACYSSTPFHGTYQIKELGFSMSFVSVLSIVMAISRSLFSFPLGIYADKYSFVKMLNICFAVELAAFGLFAFIVPENGKVLYVIYMILHGIGMAGINSGAINLIYDYIDKEKRTSALALKSTVSGFAGFFTTIFISPLVTMIQNNGNKFLGINLYAQQLTSMVSFLTVVGLLIYINTAFVNKTSRK